MDNTSPSNLNGLDPASLLRRGMEQDTIVDSIPQRLFSLPSLEELASAFPRFDILELIGAGGMGAVYKARQKELDRIVALKILPKEISSDPAFSGQFEREAKALAKLNHPNIVAIYEFGQEQDLYYIVMEYVDGLNLRRLMQNGRISPREALAIVPQICDALQYAHDRNIIHRDIKPENILLDKQGRVKVADFGLAKLVAGEHPPEGYHTQKTLLMKEGKIMGTPAYMAPEQFINPSDIDNRTDIYALGVVFYQMLTGELPDKPITPPSKKIQIDINLDEIILRALEKDPDHRYTQASIMKTRLEELPDEKIKKPKKRRGVLIVSSIALLGILLLFSCIYWFKFKPLMAILESMKSNAKTPMTIIPPKNNSVSLSSGQSVLELGTPTSPIIIGETEFGPDKPIKLSITAKNSAKSAPETKSKKSVTLSEEKPDSEISLAWLSLIDEGKYSEYYDASTKQYKSNYTKSESSNQFSEIRDSFGKITSRTFRQQPFKNLTTLQEAGSNNRYADFEFSSTTDLQKNVIEKISFYRDDDGFWKPYEYLIELKSSDGYNETDMEPLVNWIEDIRLFNNGKTSSLEYCYSFLSESIKSKQSKPQWIEQMKKILEERDSIDNNSFGSVKRTLKKETTVNFPPDDPNIKTWVFQFDSKNEKHSHFIEEVTIVKTAYGDWKPAGYAVVYPEMPPEIEKDMGQVLSWLKLNDEGKYKESYGNLIPSIKAVLKETDWDMQMKSQRAVLGTVLSRKLQRHTPMKSVPGFPDGDYHVFLFDTQLSNKKNSVETITILKNGDGTWNIAGYFIK